MYDTRMQQVKTFILAGHETSASMLTWALYELTQNGEYMARIVEEADGVFGKGNGPETKLPGMEQLNNLVFSQCCLKVGPFVCWQVYGAC